VAPDGDPFPLSAAEALLAARGITDPSPEAIMGALIEAEFMLRSIATTRRRG
jgi:hypothetical protein